MTLGHNFLCHDFAVRTYAKLGQFLCDVDISREGLHAQKLGQGETQHDF
jgi:hypothetical protein